jgi:hypothetical protein
MEGQLRLVAELTVEVMSDEHTSQTYLMPPSVPRVPVFFLMTPMAEVCTEGSELEADRGSRIARRTLGLGACGCAGGSCARGMPGATSLERRLKQRRRQPQTAPGRMESGGEVAVEEVMAVMMVMMGDGMRAAGPGVEQRGQDRARLSAS